MREVEAPGAFGIRPPRTGPSVIPEWPWAKTENERVSSWVKENMLEFGLDSVLECFQHRYSPTPLLALPHGGMVYDVDGQNSGWGTCLTESTNPEDIRQLIFFPDGHLRYSWKHTGAIIL